MYILSKHESRSILQGSYVFLSNPKKFNYILLILLFKNSVGPFKFSKRSKSKFWFYLKTKRCLIFIKNRSFFEIAIRTFIIYISHELLKYAEDVSSKTQVVLASTENLLMPMIQNLIWEMMFFCQKFLLLVHSYFVKIFF